MQADLGPDRQRSRPRPSGILLDRLSGRPGAEARHEAAGGTEATSGGFARVLRPRLQKAVSGAVRTPSGGVVPFASADAVPAPGSGIVAFPTVDVVPSPSVGAAPSPGVGAAAGGLSTARRPGGTFGTVLPAAVVAGSGSHTSTRTFPDGLVPVMGVAAGLSTAAALTGPHPPGCHPAGSPVPVPARRGATAEVSVESVKP